MRYFHYLTLTIMIILYIELSNYNLTNQNQYNITFYTISDNNLSKKSTPYHFTYPIYEQI
jgi:hypothetical protein